MSRRRELESHRHALDEVRSIMNSMKTLAYMETRKLARFVDAQRAVTESIEAVAADFLSFHTDTLPGADTAPPVYLLMGSERGFCGDFNHALVHRLDSIVDTQSSGKPILIVVGHKLHTLLEDDARVTARIDGASVAEEATVVLGRIVSELSSLQERHGMLSVYGLYHSGDNEIVTQRLLPPFQDHLDRPPQYTHPPVLNLSPAGFLIELTEHYLFAALHAMLYASLTAENHNRISHLEGAIRYLDDGSNELARKCNALRQEEIIEEIEVILLSADSLQEGLQGQPASGAAGPPVKHDG